MSRLPALTPDQKQTIAENIYLFPADIMRISGMETVSKGQIIAEQKRIRERDNTPDSEYLYYILINYIEKHGLKVIYSNGVFGWLESLKPPKK